MSLSIITVNLNNRDGFARTIASVLAQEERAAEFLVVDGGSTDGSLDLIRSNAAAMSWWVSEPDSGVYAAMNKGIAAAKGEYLLFLNSGDWLVDEYVVGRLLIAIRSGKDVYYTNLVPVEDRQRTVTDLPRTLDVNFFANGCINHQNCLIRRDLLTRAGGYDERFRIVGDWHFFLKAFHTASISSEYLEDPIAFYAGGGISAQGRYETRRLAEISEAFKDVFGELAPSMQELYDYKHSVFGNTVGLFGYTRTLDFVLRGYRFFARRFPLLRSTRKHPGL